MAISKFTTAKVDNDRKGKLEISDINEEVQEVNITVILSFKSPCSIWGRLGCEAPE